MSSTSTTSTSASSTSTNAGSSSNIFSTSGGPPLILVFLAAGLLRNFVNPSNALRRRRGDSGGSLGEKPILWDIYLDYEGLDDREKCKVTEEEKANWIDVIPISAQLLVHSSAPSSSEPTIPSSSPPPQPPRPVFSRLLPPYLQPYSLAGRNVTLSGQPQSPPPSSIPLMTVSPASQSAPSSSETKIEVAVAIAMPQPPDSDNSSNYPGNDGFDFCIGLTNVSVQGDIDSIRDKDVDQNPTPSAGRSS
ncbi:hypothetical protein C8Q75DRAFT_736641 [Abortiporus biennis]|nr:hypothetical protein C8Q75DRAFT_736641 [Abortiporus biennis]